MALEALLADAMLAVAGVIILGVLGQIGLQWYAQRNVANVIEMGVQGILGLESIDQIDDATDDEE